MQYTEEERAFIWLCCVAEADYHSRVALLHAAPSPEALMKEPEKYFPHAAGAKYTPDARKRAEELEAFLSSLEKKGYFAVTLVSDDYPESLKHISLPPLLLFGKGNCSNGANSASSARGSRRRGRKNSPKIFRRTSRNALRS